MSEGETHSRLVNAMLVAIQAWARSDVLDIWADQPNVREHLSPFYVGEVQPDLIIFERDTRLAIIGEAKTSRDIDNFHTRKQFRDYFEYLLTQPSGMLWVSVPLGRGGEVLRIAKTLRREFKCERVGLTVSEWLLGQTSEYETRWNA